MMPEHPHVTRWKEVCSELMVSSYSRESDMDRTEPVLDGKSPKEWLKGYNAREDGIVLNHGFINADYTTCITSQLRAVLFCSLAGIPVPESFDFNANMCYSGLTCVNFDSPPFDEPGGTMYIPGSVEVYYPQGNDWSLYRVPCFYNLDIYAHVFGYDRDIPVKAFDWIPLRAEKMLQMQSRHEDGRMYTKEEFKTYPAIEQYVIWQIADAYLLLWLDAHGQLSKKQNWLMAKATG